MNKNKAPKKITAAQMERLFRFTREHFVEHYDLQAELADHLANAIEERWQHYPEQDFEDALQAEFKKFGVFGFSEIVDKRQKVLTKKYYKLLWGYFKNFLRLPQVLGTISAVLVVYAIVKYIPILYLILVIVFTVVGVRALIKNTKAYKRKKDQTGRKWLLEEIIIGSSGFLPPLYIPLQFYLHTPIGETPEKLAHIWLLSVALVVCFLYGYISLFLLPKKAEKHLKEAYPEYSIIEE